MNYSDVWSDPDPVRYFGSGLRFRKKRLEEKSLPWGTATLSSIYLIHTNMVRHCIGRGPFRLCVAELLLFSRLFISSTCICIWIRLFKSSLPGSDVSSRPYLDPTFQVVRTRIRRFRSSVEGSDSIMFGPKITLITLDPFEKEKSYNLP